jgi:hypothetical protein
MQFCSVMMKSIGVEKNDTASNNKKDKMAGDTAQW